MQMTTISERVVIYVAEHLHLLATAFVGYGKRRGTRYDQLQDIYSSTAIAPAIGMMSCHSSVTCCLLRWKNNDEALPRVV